MTATQPSAQPVPQPTVVLVHGAFADGSSWNVVIELLQQQGRTVVAAANPLRGVASDSAYVASLVGQIDGPVLLVGHSYGGRRDQQRRRHGGQRRGPGLRGRLRPRRG